MNSELISRIASGVLVSSGIALLGYRRGSLSGPGAIAAIVTGTLTTGYGGYSKAILLVAFFTSSTALTKAGRARKEAANKFSEKGGRRDAWQVVANGGVSTALATISRRDRHLSAYAGSLAAVTGDTWATEIGARSPTPPMHVLSGKKVEPGASGGITPYGTAASLLGGALIGVLAALTQRYDRSTQRRPALLVVSGVAAGAAGSLIDSLIGATLQERRWCDRCGQPTERKIHICGEHTDVVGGIRGLDNDAVNLLCSLSGAAIGVLFDRVFHGGDAELS